MANQILWSWPKLWWTAAGANLGHKELKCVGQLTAEGTYLGADADMKSNKKDLRHSFREGTSL